jgi:hypothetical protein
MKKHVLSAAVLSAVCTLWLAPAHAQATRTWVSGVGDDANPCSRTAPCKTFAGAISKTATGGEISVLDPGGFGAVTITKSITLNGEGTLAGILNAGTNGVIISPSIPSGSKVILRNISIAGGGTGLNGIRHLGAAELVVDRVQIYGQTGAGIDMSLAALSATLQANDLVISGVATGINVTTTAGFATASVRGARFYGNSSAAISVGANGDATVTDSVFAGNASAVTTTSTGQAFIANSHLQNNGTAFNSGAGSNIRISNNDMSNNVNNFNLGGTISSAGNNHVIGGGANNPNGAAISVK